MLFSLYHQACETGRLGAQTTPNHITGHNSAVEQNICIL